MGSTRTARLLPFPPAGPRRTPRRPRPRGGGVTLAFDLARRRPAPRAPAGPATAAPATGPRPRGARARAHPRAREVLADLFASDPDRQARFPRDLQTQVQFLVRGRAGAIVSQIVGPTTRPHPPLTTLLDLDTYRTVMADATWAAITQAVIRTRSYEAGLEAGLLLLQVAEIHHRQLSRRAVETHVPRLYAFVLDLLDRLDRWDDYLAAWASIRAHTAWTLTYAARARRRHGARLAPFILQEDATTLWVHFLWLTAHRKAVIERKLDRRGRGRKLGNLKHHAQEELSTTELHRRVAWSVQIAHATSGTDDPPEPPGSTSRSTS